MAKPSPKTSAAKVKGKKTREVDQVDLKNPDLSDENFLAYALELGQHVSLIQRFSGAKNTETLRLGSKENSEIAHFILRQWPDRVVNVKHKVGEEFFPWSWTVSGGPSGEALFFDSDWSPEAVAVRMKLALAGPVAEGYSPVIEARRKLVWVAANKANEIVAQRRAESVWPPVQGTVRASRKRPRSRNHFRNYRLRSENSGRACRAFEYQEKSGKTRRNAQAFRPAGHLD
ncbi:MAG: hypothetical protein WCI40_09170 [Verrucomicrobiota bacterium]